METADILTETFNKMPDIFLSKEFYAEARKAGITEKALTHGIAFSFLKEVASQPYFGARTWHKRTEFRKKNICDPLIPKDFPEIKLPDISIPGNPFPLTEETCIGFLKSKGYKIFKYTEL